MDFDTLTRLRQRLTEEHLGRRLRRQTEHVAMRFGVRSGRLFRFYWENFDVMPKALGVILKATRLMEWAQTNAVAYRLEELDIRIQGLPETFEGYRILHLSDLHIDAILDGGASLFRMLARLQYDLCVLTGDYRFDTYGAYDGTMVRMERLMEVLSCPDGVVGILGNHDFIEMVPALEAMGIIMLLNESLTIERGGERIRIVGVDDAHYYEVADLTRAMTGVDVSSEVVVLLVHSPELIEEAEALGVDLYLCGHTHGGQVCLPGRIPVIGNARCTRSQVSGRWCHGRMWGYTHNGTGASGLAVRINCPPEIVIHRLTGGGGRRREGFFPL